MKRGLIVGIAGLVLLSGCAPTFWVQTKGPQQMEKLSFSAEIPEGWMRMNREEFLLITRDGSLLQLITVDRTKIDSPLPHTKRKLEKGMLPQEAAEVVLDNITSNPAVQNFELKENQPATIADRPGFRLVYSYRNRDGLKQRVILHGFLAGEWFYDIRYSAAERYYFDKDLKTFDRFVSGFRLTGP